MLLLTLWVLLEHAPNSQPSLLLSPLLLDVLLQAATMYAGRRLLDAALLPALLTFWLSCLPAKNHARRPAPLPALTAAASR
jgi:hypothetical protein